MKALIRKLSAPGEFCLVLIGCTGFAIVSSIWSIATRSWLASPHVRVTNASVLIGVILELLAVAVMYWIGRARGWSFASWGFLPSWKLTGAGILLFVAILMMSFSLSELSNLISPGAIHRRTEPHVSLLVLALTVAINPVFEEILETGYFVQSLQRYGMWAAVFASAAFRAFLHAYQGINALALIFPIGLIFGFTYWKWRRLWPLLIAHGLLDLYAFLLAGAV